MNHQEYFYNCSKEYINSIDSSLYEEVETALCTLPKRATQSEINNDCFWLLGSNGWSYDTLSSVSDVAPKDLQLPSIERNQLENQNIRDLCLTTTSLGASWHSDFAKWYPSGLVQLEVQFGKVESMFKDFCGFRIAAYERRIALGIEIVMSNPTEYFSHRKTAVSGMAYFDVAKKTLPAIGLDCPIWLIGIDCE